MASAQIGIHVTFNRLPTYQARLLPAVHRGLVAERDRLTAAIRANVHVVTGFMRANITAEPAVDRGGTITTSIQSRAPYSGYEEFGHHLRNGVWWSGHRKITEAVEANRAGYTAALARAIAAGLRD